MILTGIYGLTLYSHYSPLILIVCTFIITVVNYYLNMSPQGRHFIGVVY